MIDVEKLKALISYDPRTGLMIRVKTGKAAGSINKNGYVRVFFDGKLHYAHRLAWAMHTGMEPKDMIDHVDGNPTNNSISNLREATPVQNQFNRVVGSNNTSGHTGVTFRKDRGTWRAQIYKNNKLIYLGSYKEKILAVNAYREAAKKLGKEFFTRGVNS